MANKSKFDAAVRVIQGLPKDGPFQPSDEVRLKFYAYYKQATCGPCNNPKPAFWDVVGKAKWTAWNDVKSMSAEEAMNAYVDQLKQMIEAMPHSQFVHDFMTECGLYYEVVDTNSEPGTPPNGLIEGMSSSQRDCPSATENNGENDLEATLANGDSSKTTMAKIDIISQKMAALDNGWETDSLPSPRINGHSPTMNGFYPIKDVCDESDGEEFCDTSDLPLGFNEEFTTATADSPILDDASKTLIVKHMSAKITSPACQTVGVNVSADSPVQTAVCAARSVEPVTTRGGGGETSPSDEGPHRVVRSREDVGGSSGRQHTGRSHRPLVAGGQDETRGASGGGSAGAGGGGNQGGTYRGEASEQIALALLRLQQDMNSILVRLQTLETLTVAQQQEQRRRQESSSQTAPWWWFPRINLSGRGVFFVLVWPFIVHWIVSCIARRRRRQNR